MRVDAVLAAGPPGRSLLWCCSGVRDDWSGYMKGRGYDQGAKRPSLCGYERIIAPHLFRESSTRLGCYQRIQWKKFVTTS